jgi:hypothetical protein
VSVIASLLAPSMLFAGGDGDRPQPKRPDAHTASAATKPAPDRAALDAVNAYRARAGLAAVKLDAALSKGCMEHAIYMKLNRGTAAMAGLEAHKQRPKLPGATPAGAACAKAADLFPGVSDLDTAVAGWMAGIYHRRPIMDPTLTTIGVGYAQLDDGSYMAALMLVDSKSPSTQWPVTYPVDRQSDVPLELGHEIPMPSPNGIGGYPVTLQFPPFDKVTGVKATLAIKGKAVPIHLSDPEHPASSFGQFGVVSLIAEQPLQPATTYAVKIAATWQGVAKTWTWSFTTLALRPVDANDGAAMEAAIGIASRVRGKVVHTGMIDTETVFLALTDDHDRKLVSVVIPLAVWTELAHGAKPETFRGKALEVEATPQLVTNKFINLTITVVNQLHVAH